ncbi:VanZ family protein [Petroclostridium sp. X23]|jgi:VanZ family protein|uniref:VanZ family protein n=1 Tax=Petroclostridium sp. X23 TaxID=3045146 RepID=UPI0024ACD2D0|nr:VanZ family protein [Petroclostridium sp. X23]WHH57512.1 VanZ family protein [Petroclostridium sp. X23]
MVKKRSLLYLLTILWFVVILSFSSDPAEISKQKSALILEKVEPAIERVERHFELEFFDKDSLHFYIRKNAHIFNYFVLGMLLTLCWKVSGVKGHKSYYLPWVAGTLFSMLDEFYQTFIPGRSGEVRDVFVDNTGIVMGLIVASIFYSIIVIRVKRARC